MHRLSKVHCTCIQVENDQSLDEISTESRLKVIAEPC